MLIVQDFLKYYGSHLVLEVPSLKMQTGIHWFKGDNGSGKTSFFKCVAGLLPYQGTIRFEDGIDLRQNPVQYRHRVSYSEAEPVYPGFLSSKDLVHFIAHVRGSTLEKEQELIELFGINEFIEKPCETYSSGMMKKLSLALAFIGSPRVIVLDEPLITLDEKARTALAGLVQLRLSKDVIFLVSSHQLLQGQDLTASTIYSVGGKTITLEQNVSNS